MADPIQYPQQQSAARSEPDWKLLTKNLMKRIPYNVWENTVYFDLYKNPHPLVKLEPSKGIMICEDMRQHPVITACLELRFNAILEMEWSIAPASDDPEDVRRAKIIEYCFRNLNTQLWNGNSYLGGPQAFILQALEGLVTGVTFPQAIWNQDEGRIVETRHCDPRAFTFEANPDEYGAVASWWTGTELYYYTGVMGQKYPAPDYKFMHMVYRPRNNNPYGNSALWPVYQPYILTFIDGVRMWLNFIDRFGAPSLVALIESAFWKDDEYIAKAVDWLAKVQTGFVGAAPTLSNGQPAYAMMESNRTSSNDVYANFVDKGDRWIATGLIGAPLAILESQFGTRAQSQTHQEVNQVFTKGDVDYVQAQMQIPIVWMYDVMFGKPEMPKLKDLRSQSDVKAFEKLLKPVYPTFKLAAKEDKDMLVEAQTVNMWQKAGYPFTKEFISELTGYPIPEAGADILKPVSDNPFGDKPPGEAKGKSMTTVPEQVAASDDIGDDEYSLSALPKYSAMVRAKSKVDLDQFLKKNLGDNNLGDYVGHPFHGNQWTDIVSIAEKAKGVVISSALEMEPDKSYWVTPDGKAISDDGSGYDSHDALLEKILPDNSGGTDYDHDRKKAFAAGMLRSFRTRYALHFEGNYEGAKQKDVIQKIWEAHPDLDILLEGPNLQTLEASSEDFKDNDFNISEVIADRKKYSHVKLGDYVGHPFHGNQWVEGQGGMPGHWSKTVPAAQVNPGRKSLILNSNLVVGPDAPPKDKPLTIVYGGTFNPVHEGHVDALKDSITKLEDAGYKVGQVIVTPSADKLAINKLGDRLIPLNERTKMAEMAFERIPQAIVTDGPAIEAENWTGGKLRRTQLADWARTRYPNTSVVAISGVADAPGHPPADLSLYSGDKGSTHEGYYYMALPRDEGNGISSSRIRSSMKDTGQVPSGYMNPHVETYYKNYMATNPHVKLGDVPGHPFHGNQWTVVDAAGVTHEAGKATSELLARSIGRGTATPLRAIAKAVENNDYDTASDYFNYSSSWPYDYPPDKDTIDRAYSEMYAKTQALLDRRFPGQSEITVYRGANFRNPKSKLGNVTTNVEIARTFEYRGLIDAYKIPKKDVVVDVNGILSSHGQKPVYDYEAELIVRKDALKPYVQIKNTPQAVDHWKKSHPVPEKGTQFYPKYNPELGDLPGHPFHGNQYVDGEGGVSNTVETKQKHVTGATGETWKSGAGGHDIADYKADRPLTGEGTRPITDVVSGTNAIHYFETPGLDQLHTDMGAGVVTGMTPDYEVRRAKFFSKMPEQTIPINKLTFTQEGVNLNRIKELQTSPTFKDMAKKPVFVLQHGQQYYLMNGHHRVVAGYLNGENDIRAKVYNAGEKKLGDLPGHEFHGNQWTGGIGGDLSEYHKNDWTHVDDVHGLKDRDPNDPVLKSIVPDDIIKTEDGVTLNGQQARDLYTQHLNEALAQPLSHMIDTPERWQQRFEWAAQEYAEKSATSVKNKELWVMGGISASGKSTIADPIAKVNGAITIDTDSSGLSIPESAGGKYNPATHDEAEWISKMVRYQAMENGDNIVLPKIGNNPESMTNLLREFKDHGYTIHYITTTIPTSTAIQRNTFRTAFGKQTVPNGYIVDTDNKPVTTYYKMKKETYNGAPLVDDYVLYDTSTPKGTPPKVLDRGTNG